jgi:hypothetical protein
MGQHIGVVVVVYAEDICREFDGLGTILLGKFDAVGQLAVALVQFVVPDEQPDHEVSASQQALPLGGRPPATCGPDELSASSRSIWLEWIARTLYSHGAKQRKVALLQTFELSFVVDRAMHQVPLDQRAQAPQECQLGGLLTARAFQPRPDTVGCSSHSRHHEARCER